MELSFNPNPPSLSASQLGLISSSIKFPLSVKRIILLTLLGCRNEEDVPVKS